MITRNDIRFELIESFDGTFHLVRATVSNKIMVKTNNVLRLHAASLEPMLRKEMGEAI
jgi:hypothetical protein